MRLQFTGIITALFHTPSSGASTFWLCGTIISGTYLVSRYIQYIVWRKDKAGTDPYRHFKDLYRLEENDEIHIPGAVSEIHLESNDKMRVHGNRFAIFVALFVIMLSGFEVVKNTAVNRLWFSAETLASDGALPAAEHYYRRALLLDQSSPTGHMLLGKCLVSQHKLKQAIPHLKRAQDGPTLGPETALQLGACEMRTGNMQGAEKAYRKAVAIAPRSPETHVRLGQCLAAEGHVADAIRLFEYALQLDQNSAAAHSSMGLALLALGRNEEAILHLKRGVELAPDSLTSRNGLGTAYAVSGHYTEAIDQFRAEIALEPRFAAGYFNLASALEKSNHNGEALVTYETYLRRCANHPDGQLTAAPEAFKAIQRLRTLLSTGAASRQNSL